MARAALPGSPAGVSLQAATPLDDNEGGLTAYSKVVELDDPQSPMWPILGRGANGKPVAGGGAPNLFAILLGLPWRLDEAAWQQERKGGHQLPSIDVLRLQNHSILNMWEGPSVTAKRYAHAVVEHRFFDRIFYTDETFLVWPKLQFVSAMPFSSAAAAEKHAGLREGQSRPLSFKPLVQEATQVHQDAKKFLQAVITAGQSFAQAAEPAPRQAPAGVDNSSIATMDLDHFARAFALRAKS